MARKSVVAEHTAFNVHAFPMVHIAALHRGYNALLASEFASLGISPQMWRILALLQEKDGYSSRHLSDASLIEQSHFSRIIDAMQADGFVTRVPQPRDKRVKLIRLTRKGHRLFEDLLPRVLALYEKLFDGFDQSELDSLTGFLQRIRSNMST